MKIGLRTNLREVKREHGKFRKDQVPFATSGALNDTAKRFQKDQTRAMRRSFTERNRLFLSRAVKIKPFASKKRLVAQVQIAPPGSPRTADILSKFERGGTKKPRGQRLAVPKDVKRTRAGKVSPSLRPKALEFQSVSSKVSVGQKRTIAFRLPGGRGGIYQRVGRKGRSSLRLLFLFIPRARIEPRLNFYRRARRVGDRFYQSFFNRRYARAVKTAR